MSSASKFPIVRKPALALWIFQRDLNNGVVGEALDIGAEQVRRYCLPFGHPLRAVPREDVLTRIVAMTDGAIGVADFHPPHVAAAPRADVEPAADEDWIAPRDFLNAPEAV